MAPFEGDKLVCEVVTSGPCAVSLNTDARLRLSVVAFVAEAFESPEATFRFKKTYLIKSAVRIAINVKQTT